MKKYEKVSKQDYETWYRGNKEYRKRVALDPGRLSYHLMPETGWLNDPNGLCQFHGTYHIYYQYTPFEPTGELKLWGHYTTKDFVNYQQEEPVLFPDSELDVHGVYSGSAFVENGTIHYFYTGNVKYFDRPDYDYIMSGRGSNTIHVTSPDGYHFSGKEAVLTQKDYPADMSCHIRDPKIFKKDGIYYMALGARDQENRGMALLYRSEDLEKWEYYNRITTREPFGYMWECPDLFLLDGQLCLMICPQGVKRRGVDFANVHQCTVMKLDYDFENNTYEIEKGGKVRLVDRGFDFYAPQSFEDERGRRIMIGWMGIPDADYTNPTVEAGWQHALTLPRELHMKNGRLIQLPVEELKELRGRRREYDLSESDWKAEKKTVYEAEIEFDFCDGMRLELRRGIYLTYQNRMLTLDLGRAGSGRADRSVELDKLEVLRVYSDTTSLEIFVNGGEEVFTTRVYQEEGCLDIMGNCGGRIILYDLKSFKYHNNQKI